MMQKLLVLIGIAGFALSVVGCFVLAIAMMRFALAFSTIWQFADGGGDLCFKAAAWGWQHLYQGVIWLLLAVIADGPLMEKKP
jgi:hypothetical protein